MVISKTPLRISLVGGGTDVPAFYRKYGGAVVSFTISKFIYVSVNDKFNGRTRVSYSQTENVDDPSELQHDLVRETLVMLDEKGLEITSVSDIPGEGTGLGSSSSFTVGLLAALSQKINSKPYPRKILAETAHTIESKLCKHPGVGKQDVYAAAFGGLHYYQFNKDESVSVEPIFMNAEQKENLESHLILLYTDLFRSADFILGEQERNIGKAGKSQKAALALKELAFDLGTEMQAGHFCNIGQYLKRGWELKKWLSNSISNPYIDELHARGIEAGAEGAKLCGAGGGGFFLFYAEPECHKAIQENTGLRCMPFKMENEGSTIIYHD